MKIYAMNGTSAVNPIQGTNDVVLQGTNDVVLQGTNDVVLQGGTSAVGPMQGYQYPSDLCEACIPVQTVNGSFYVAPLALMDADDVPLEGIPGHWSDEDIDAYQVGYLYGDADALNGNYEVFEGKRKQRREEKRAAKDARRAERQAQRARRKEARTAKLERGEGFFDKVGTGLAALATGAGEGLAAASAATEDFLADEGIDAMPDIIQQRNLLTGGDTGGEAGAGAAGLAGWWQSLGTPAKVGVGVGAAALGYLLYKQFSKKGRKK